MILSEEPSQISKMGLAPEPSRAQLGGSMGAFFLSPFYAGQVEQNPGVEPFSSRWHKAGQPLWELLLAGLVFA